MAVRSTQAELALRACGLAAKCGDQGVALSWSGALVLIWVSAGVDGWKALWLAGGSCGCQVAGMLLITSLDQGEIRG